VLTTETVKAIRCPPFLRWAPTSVIQHGAHAGQRRVVLQVRVEGEWLSLTDAAKAVGVEEKVFRSRAAYAARHDKDFAYLTGDTPRQGGDTWMQALFRRGRYARQTYPELHPAWVIIHVCGLIDINGRLTNENR
jgi:hypothetical protein